MFAWLTTNRSHLQLREQHLAPVRNSMPRANIEHAAKQHVATLAIALHNRHVANKRHKLVELKIGVPLRFVAAWRFDDDPLVLRFSEGVGARELHLRLDLLRGLDLLVPVCVW